MTPDEQRRSMAADLRPWVDRAAMIVDRRFADARAYAERGDVDTAKARIAELAGALIRHASDARRLFYHASFNAHRSAGLDPTIHQLDVGPTPDGEQAASSVPILGRSFSRDVLDLAADTMMSLDSAVFAGDPEFVEAWHGQQPERFKRRAAAELSDAQIALYESIGQLLVKPELR